MNGGGGGGGDGGIIAAATAGVSARIAWIYRSPHLRGDSHRKLDVLASPGFSLPQGLRAAFGAAHRSASTT